MARVCRGSSLKFVIAILFMPFLFSSAQGAEWHEGSFNDLARQTFEDSDVRLSNCHLEWLYLDNEFKASPACYVMNLSGERIRVRVEFEALDSGSKRIFYETSEWPLGMPNMSGSEYHRRISVSPQDRACIARMRVRMFLSPP